jgi:hypothetical protein
MCLNQGRRPSASEFKERVHARNLDHLTIWHNVGADVENGMWAIFGARLGTYMTMITEWDYTEVQDFDKLAELWQEHGDVPKGPVWRAEELEESLRTQLDLPMNTLTEDQSRFFKHHYRSNWHNRGVMIREMDVIRSQEGW